MRPYASGSPCGSKLSRANKSQQPTIAPKRAIAPDRQRRWTYARSLQKDAFATPCRPRTDRARLDVVRRDFRRIDLAACSGLVAPGARARSASCDGLGRRTSARAAHGRRPLGGVDMRLREVVRPAVGRSMGDQGDVRAVGRVMRISSSCRRSPRGGPLDRRRGSRPRVDGHRAAIETQLGSCRGQPAVRQDCDGPRLGLVPQPSAQGITLVIPGRSNEPHRSTTLRAATEGQRRSADCPP